MLKNHRLVEFAPTALTVRGQVAESLIFLRPESGNTETRKAPQKTASRAQTVHFEIFKNQPLLIALSIGPKDDVIADPWSLVWVTVHGSGWADARKLILGGTVVVGNGTGFHRRILVLLCLVVLERRWIDAGWKLIHRCVGLRSVALSGGSPAVFGLIL